MFEPDEDTPATTDVLSEAECFGLLEDWRSEEERRRHGCTCPDCEWDECGCECFKG